MWYTKIKIPVLEADAHERVSFFFFRVTHLILSPRMRRNTHTHTQLVHFLKKKKKNLTHNTKDTQKSYALINATPCCFIPDYNNARNQDY